MQESLDYQLLEKAYAKLLSHWKDAAPECGLILGSGWSDAVAGFDIKDTVKYGDIPGLGKTGVVGHAGQCALAECAGLQTIIFQGRRHWYEGEGWTPVAVPVYIMKKLGVKRVLLTNAAGGINPDMKPGDLMVLDDHLNNFPTNPLIGPHHEIWGPRFPDQTEIYNKGLRVLMDLAADQLSLKIYHGVYLASPGPVYETPAEIRRYKVVGADAVGMSTVPEALLANAAGLNVAGLSCISNLAAGISPQPLSHEEVTEATQEAMPRMRNLLKEYWNQMSEQEGS